MKTYRITYHTNDGKSYEVIQNGFTPFNLEGKYLEIQSGFFGLVIICVENLCAITVEEFKP